MYTSCTDVCKSVHRHDWPYNIDLLHSIMKTVKSSDKYRSEKERASSLYIDLHQQIELIPNRPQEASISWSTRHDTKGYPSSECEAHLTRICRIFSYSSFSSLCNCRARSESFLACLSILSWYSLYSMLTFLWSSLA